MGRVFISYRRMDTEADAGRLYADLAAEFGEDSLYKDVDSVPLGENFQQHIADALDGTDLVIAVIGPDWNEVRTKSEADWVTFELETAFAKKIPIIPVRVRRAEMPKPSDLPGSLRQLAYLNAGELEHSSWARDLNPLFAAIRSRLSGGVLDQRDLPHAAKSHNERDQPDAGLDSSRLGRSFPSRVQYEGVDDVGFSVDLESASFFVRWERGWIDSKLWIDGSKCTLKRIPSLPEHELTYSFVLVDGRVNRDGRIVFEDLSRAPSILVDGIVVFASPD